MREVASINDRVVVDGHARPEISDAFLAIYKARMCEAVRPRASIIQPRFASSPGLEIHSTLLSLATLRYISYVTFLSYLDAFHRSFLRCVGGRKKKVNSVNGESFLLSIFSRTNRRSTMSANHRSNENLGRCGRQVSRFVVANGTPKLRKLGRKMCKEPPTVAGREKK